IPQIVKPNVVVNEDQAVSSAPIGVSLAEVRNIHRPLNDVTDAEIERVMCSRRANAIGCTHLNVVNAGGQVDVIGFIERPIQTVLSRQPNTTTADTDA